LLPSNREASREGAFQSSAPEEVTPDERPDNVVPLKPRTLRIDKPAT
jgi:hypothetical protein